MKKILLILLAILVVGCGKKEIDFHDDKIDKLKDNYENIEKVVAIDVGEGGYTCYDITDYKKNAYDSVVNMKVIEKTESYARDKGLIYQFVLNNSDVISFEFNNGSYVKSIDELYLLEKTHYDIKYDNQIECIID